MTIRQGDTLASRDEYRSRFNRVLDFIDANLGRDIALAELAQVACFSPFHFLRIFQALAGETPGQYLQRLRLEKAASQLCGNPKKSVTEIALDCGFSSSAAFARAFRGAFGMTASAWRESKSGHALRKIDQSFGNPGKDFPAPAFYVDTHNNQLRWRLEMKNRKTVDVVVKNLPEMPVVYVRHIGPYQGDAELFRRLIDKLMTWAGSRSLLRFPETEMMSIYHDDPEVTDENKLRVSMAITVPPETQVDGEIGKMTLAGGAYALARFELAADEYQDAWDAVLGGWLPTSGYQPDDRPSLEIYRNDPDEHPEKKCVVDICLPVKPL